MQFWLGSNLPHKTTENIGRSLLEVLGRCLDDRLTLSCKELHAVAYGSDVETEEHDLEKLGKDNGGKLNETGLNQENHLKESNRCLDKQK